MDERLCLYLAGLINEEQMYSESKDVEIKNYMFFNNLQNIKEKVDKMLSMDKAKIDKMVSDGHDWASDHISTSRDDIEEVYNWLTGSRK